MSGRCVDPACTDGPRESDDEPMPRMTRHGFLCQRCTDALERRLAELPARRNLLRAIAALVLSSRSRGEHKPTKGDPPVEFNIAVHDHLEHLHGVIVSWVRLVCEERGLRGPDGNDIERLAPWLLGQLDWLTGQAWVGDMCDEIRDLTRVADGITQHIPGWHRLPAPCPACDHKTLGRWDGGDQVGCTNCGQQWPERDYPFLVRVLATDTGTSVTAAEAAERAAVEPATFRQWVSRGKVRRLGTVDGLARYSTADIDAVLDTPGQASCG